MVTYEQAIRILEKDIDYDLNSENHMLGLRLLEDAGVEINFSSGHDIIYCADFEESLTKLDFGHISLLSSYGFFESEDSWAFFC